MDDSPPASMELHDEFNELVAIWDRETLLMSSALEIMEHWAYQRITGMGEPVVPLILGRMCSKGPDHWFLALTAITGEDADIGKDTMQSATEAWIAWGRERGII
jgi:hypothetical protein